MKKILLVVHPKWCEKIFSGEKTIEVRRNRPKLEPPFTVYVYCTKAKNIREDGLYLLPNDKELYLGCKEKDLGFVCWEGDFRNGKVIGSFVCDKITRYESEFWDDDTYERIQEPWELPDFSEYGEYEYDTIGINGEFYGAGVELSKQSCLSWNELRSYVGQGIRNFYGWHLTEPKLFDKPKELSEFYIPCKWYEKGKGCPEDCALFDYEGAIDDTDDFCLGQRPIIRPPQSFCYIVEYPKCLSQ